MSGVCPGCGNSFDGDNLCMPSACQWEGTEEERVSDLDANLEREVHRLRARVAELEAAGDRLENAAAWTALDVRDGALDDALIDWRAVRREGSE